MLTAFLRGTGMVWFRVHCTRVCQCWTLVAVGVLALAAVGCGGGTVSGSAPPPPPPPAADTAPPSVSVTAPSNGATVSGQLTVAATASDNVAVLGVQFQLNGSNLGAEITTAPYSVTWDSRAVANGQHNLQAKARDAAGNTATSTVNVVVSNILALRVTTTSLPAAVVGQPYAAAASAQGGVPPYTWALSGGTLPAGLTMDAAGNFSGATSALGLFPFVLQVRDSAGTTASASFSISGVTLSPLMVPAAGGSVVDPVTGNRIHRVTDRLRCPNGGQHFYSYVPVWNASGTHFVIECQGWIGGQGSSALLIRDSDLAVQGDLLAMAGAPNSVNPGRIFPAWTNASKFYGYGQGSLDGQLWEMDPFAARSSMLKNFRGMVLGGRTVDLAVLAYVSFDDRYFLMELYSGGSNFGLAVWDRQTDAISFAPLTALCAGSCSFYDEAVFTQDNRVWVVGSDSTGAFHSWVWRRDFSAIDATTEHGHHAQGMLLNGTPVAVKATSSQCPPGSAAGNPNGSFRPSGTIFDLNARAEVLQLACNITGFHELDHYSWNSILQRDRFFVTTKGGVPSGPIRDAIIRVRLQFNPAGTLVGHAIDVVAYHRSEYRFGYGVLPRASCNQQGTRCLFNSSMTFDTNNTDPQPHLYVVDVP